ncbi:MAG: Uma2 family endonuclease [Gomphosphaeria aponina SAG 52.96 = DSM 107014]|uniref:Uma2 family endonuclease n=1 Tax=Gomphosphaeria aponina SAG 52.96 = DSM 107014 TaxID=1521640 RepID=A0A941GS06_9CHRO|nr:Uma2 family endonuclease [Gomphosphaeria aponina SAG 52.96 = DSM 107014]
MTAQLIEKIKPVGEQRFVFPGYYNWQQFKAIQALLEEVPGVSITYLDGCVELMTTGEKHERIKKFLAILLEAYFFELGIKFIPVGNATRESKGASFEPDESYYLGEKKDNPNLAVEIILTSGGIDKLEKYKRFQITEVWFWENNQLSIYYLEKNKYEQVQESKLLPDLDIALLVRCVQMSDILDARTEFLNTIRQ